MRDPATLNQAEAEALWLLGVYTGRRFDLWLIAGRAKASCRAHIMSALAGKSVPQSQAGVTLLEAAFHAMANPEGDCKAVREDAFIDWARNATEEMHP